MKPYAQPYLYSYVQPQTSALQQCIAGRVSENHEAVHCRDWFSRTKRSPNPGQNETPTCTRKPGHQIFFKHGVRLVEAAEIQLEALGRPAAITVFILPYLCVLCVAVLPPQRVAI